ncbi:pentatricopeptide repeat-containing protein At5g48910 [Magnolia sinica]|uniref:pentatricopeptide repeat-containing protein At5g48910 n=1 Tax=Magnolia sinica TaxID=86752 RepID=UPI0026582FBD|nr:pentatricopeptide repeat-containing protein At5g48910 [Magnolia sinica]
MLLFSCSSVLKSSPCLHPPSSFLILPEIKTCKTIRDLQQLHAQKIKTGRIRDPFIAAEILKFCALSDHHRNLRYARMVFYQMEEPNCFSWNTIIRAFSESDEPFEALVIYHRMLCDESAKPNHYTFPPVLKACARVTGIEEGKQIHGQIIKRGLDCDGFVRSNLVRMYVFCGVMDDAHRLFNRSVESDDAWSDDVREGNVVLWNVVIDGYIRLGATEDARRLFDKMPQRSLVSWNGMIAGYAQNGFFKEALEIFHEMQMANVQPNYVTLVSILPAISRLGALDMGKWVHAFAEKNKIEVDDVLGSALIDMYSKCGSIDKALQVFRGLPQRNSVTWSTIIGGLAMHGQAKDALDHFLQMELAGVMPSDVAFIGVLSACSHAGLVDEARSYWNKMTRVYGLRPRIEHYGCMVDLFGRAGLLQEAEELVLNMPMKPDDVIWKALLGACRIHGNVEMGECVAKRLMELAPHDGGCYVLLSNMYASLGRWEAVAEVRLMMKEMDIRKDPGCSWIEIDGMIHEFLVEDDSHPRAKEIRSMLEEMADRSRSVGYAPDTTQVLLNIDEEERESVLYYHSEKIAIAFGLISTSPATTLRVAKNLRMCGDCHSSMKLISKLYNRRIIVRDRNRFHHFENGLCSCMDYW